MLRELQHAGSLFHGFRAAFGLAAVLSACAGPTRNPTPPGPSGGQVITARAIERSGAKTAWEALKLTAQHIRFDETGRGLPTRMTRRGRSSLLLNDMPPVYVDRTRLVDFRLLDAMPADEIESIHIISAVEATTYYGTDATAGVIVIRTRTGPIN